MSSSKKLKASAYVYINTQTDAESTVASELRKKSSVLEAYETYGVYDVVARFEVEGNSKKSLKKELIRVVEKEIRPIPGVRLMFAMRIADDKNGYLGFMKNEKGDLVHSNLKSKF